MKSEDFMYKIFVVDDSATILYHINSLLKDVFDVKLFKSGLEMLKFIKNEPNSLPDLILLDVVMPDCSGYDIIKLLKEDKRLSDIPVLFLTANDDRQGETMGLELGAVDYITKPFHPSVLMARIKTHLSNKHFQDMLKTNNQKLEEYANLLKRYLEIIELAPISILITDKNNKIIFVNRYFIEASGYSKEEILGKDPGFIKSGRTSVELYQEMWKKLNNKEVWEGVLINKKKSGELYYEETRILPIINESGEVDYYVAVKTDITEKLRLQEKENMLSKAKALINISSGIAHHLNNINTPLLIISEYLFNKLKDHREYSKMLTIMMDSVTKATNLINSIRTFSKNNIMLQSIVNFNTLIESAISKLNEIVSDNIELKVFVEKLNDLSVFVNTDMIVKAIMNVAQNSIEAMPNGGKLTIRTYSYYKNSKDYVVIEITDNGIGIPDDIKEEVFEPFFTTKGNSNAKGLGLSETLGIIEQHNGIIELESKVNVGTTLKIYLPVYKKDSP